MQLLAVLIDLVSGGWFSPTVLLVLKPLLSPSPPLILHLYLGKLFKGLVVAAGPSSNPLQGKQTSSPPRTPCE